MKTLTNNEFVSMLKSVIVWDVKHDAPYPEIDAGVVDIKSHLLVVFGDSKDLLVDFDAIISATIGNRYSGNYTEAPYTEDSEINDVNINRISIEIYDKEACPLEMKDYQRKQLMELVEKKIKSDIQGLC